MRKIFVMSVVFFIITISVFAMPSIGSKTSVKMDCIVCATIQDTDDLVNALIIKDWYGVAEIIKSGKGVEVEANAKVMVLESKPFKGLIRIRILTGSAAGYSGWLPTEIVK